MKKTEPEASTATETATAAAPQPEETGNQTHETQSTPAGNASAEPAPEKHPETPAPLPAADHTKTATDQTAETLRLIAEAEQRGYLRGLNEAAEQRMEQPTLFEDLARRREKAGNKADPVPDDPAAGFLSRISRSVWD